MIFAGDVAIASGDRITFDGFPASVWQLPWCINLEGAIGSQPTSDFWGTYNSPEWLESFETFTIGPVFAANNHIQDIPDGILLTHKWLSERGLTMIGAGANAKMAAQPAHFSSGNSIYTIVGFGWPVIGCSPEATDKPGINPFVVSSVRTQVRSLLSDARHNRVIVLIHGNYELESYPQPAHRRLAMELIDMGVYSVIFHHPHVVGPIEQYKGSLIAYSLGNWAFSYGHFFGGKLRLPQTSFHQIAVEFGDSTPIIHHANFSPPSSVAYSFSEEFSRKQFTLKPVFQGFNHNEYLKWFKINRVKRKGLPIYKNPDSGFQQYDS